MRDDAEPALRTRGAHVRAGKGASCWRVDARSKRVRKATEARLGEPTPDVRASRRRDSHGRIELTRVRDGVVAMPFAVQMTNRKLKFGLGIAAVLGLGFGIPVFAVWFTNKKLET